VTESNLPRAESLLDHAGFVRHMARVAKQAGHAGLRLHDMRHAFCSRLAQAGVPIPTIKVLAGHKSIAPTMRYAGHVPGGATFEATKRLDKPVDDSEGDAKGDMED